MNTVQLMAVMDKIAHNMYFLGVLPCDYLHKTPLKNLQAMLIFNTDPSTECLGYVRNPRSLMEGMETLCHDDIGGFTWKS